MAHAREIKSRLKPAELNQGSSYHQLKLVANMVSPEGDNKISASAMKK